MGDDEKDDNPYDPKRGSVSGLNSSKKRKGSAVPSAFPAGSRKASSVVVSNVMGSSAHGTPMGSAHPSTLTMNNMGVDSTINGSGTATPTKHVEETPHVSCKSADSNLITSLFPNGAHNV